MSITNTGVGIGTNSPSSKFEINNGTVVSFAIESPSTLTGLYNTIAGVSAGIAISGGTHNTAYGYEAYKNATYSRYDTAIGYQALYTFSYNNNNTVYSTFNTAVGAGALYSANAVISATTEGVRNTAIGRVAQYSGTTGSYNTALGYGSLYSNKTGSTNVCLGYSAGYFETGSNKLFIDNATRTNEADARVKAIVYGVFASAPASQIFTVNANLCVNGNTGIGTTTPTALLHLKNGYLKSEQTTAPTISVFSQKGITASTISTGSTDTKGVITTTGTNDGTGFSCLVFTFNTVYNSVPVVIITQASMLGLSNVQYYVVTNTGGFNLYFIATNGSINPSFNYFVIE